MSERKVYRYAIIDGKFTEVGCYDPGANRGAAPPSAYVSQDSMPPTWHPCDGNYYESKSKFREVTRAEGCEEYGNEKLKPQGRVWNETENMRALERAFKKTCEQFNL